MGQQKILLVVLVVIIVGITTMVAIKTFDSTTNSLNIEEVKQDIEQIAKSAQAYYKRPVQLRGGGDSFAGLSFDNISFVTDSIYGTGLLSADNANGSYTLSEIDSSGADDEFIITASPSSAGGTIVGTVKPNDLKIDSFTEPED